MVCSRRCDFKATNNEAEYEALIVEMNMAHDLGAKGLHMFIAESKTKLLNKEKSTSDLMRISVKQRQLYLYAKEHEEIFSDH
ncbi:hypothetical protein L6452_05236 [Arctium lappa]|uniref:Uncharacterized protein n=1 Tax=Arctium lappa TaxID=4217 RepID=A0ACB9EGH9_ARCLA|nr:hypothetical protein L6452_05236 [Arctium lappa]